MKVAHSLEGSEYEPQLPFRVIERGFPFQHQMMEGDRGRARSVGQETLASMPRTNYASDSRRQQGQKGLAVRIRHLVRSALAVSNLVDGLKVEEEFDA